MGRMAGGDTQKMAARVILGLLAASWSLSLSHAAGSSAYSAIYSFGDSLSDAGNGYINNHHTSPVSPPYSQGRYTNGQLWVQDLAASLKLPPVRPSLNRGTDFAYGGAFTGATAYHTQSNIDLPAQLSQFQAAVPHPSPTALYTVAIGSNDVRAALPYFATKPTQAQADITAAVNNEISFIHSLAGLGAKTFCVLSVTDLGEEPYGHFDPSAATAVSYDYNAELTPALTSLAAQDHISITLVNIFNLLDTVVANPAAYGLTNVTDPVWTGNLTSASSGTLNAHGPAQNMYLFWDQVHPTAAGHSIINDVVAPLF